MNLPIVDNNKQIERFYILLLEGNCEGDLFVKVKAAIKENWEENNDNLDLWVLYFVALQKERNVLNNLDNEDSLEVYLLSRINKAVNTEDNSLTIGIKSKKEINNIIHGLVYKEVEKFFDDIFLKIAPNFDYTFSLPFEKIRDNNIVRIINNFNNIFNTNRDYKNKIIEIFLQSAKKGQIRIKKEKIEYCKKGEYLYNQYLNYCFGDFFQDIGINRVPFVEFKFCNSSLWFLQTKLLPRYSTCFFLFLYPFIFSYLVAFDKFSGFEEGIKLFLAVSSALDVWLMGMLAIECVPRLKHRFSKVREMEQAKKQYVVNSNSFNEIEAVINQAVEVLENISQNDEIDILIKTMERYKELTASLTKTNTPTTICSTNVYLLTFLNNIIKNKDNLSIEDIRLSKEAFDSAINYAVRLKEQQKQKALMAKQIELNIAKQELDYLTSQLEPQKQERPIEK